MNGNVGFLAFGVYWHKNIYKIPNYEKYLNETEIEYLKNYQENWIEKYKDNWQILKK